MTQYQKPILRFLHLQPRSNKTFTHSATISWSFRAYVQWQRRLSNSQSMFVGRLLSTSLFTAFLPVCCLQIYQRRPIWLDPVYLISAPRRDRANSRLPWLDSPAEPRGLWWTFDTFGLSFSMLCATSKSGRPMVFRHFTFLFSNGLLKAKAPRASMLVKNHLESPLPRHRPHSMTPHKLQQLTDS